MLEWQNGLSCMCKIKEEKMYFVHYCEVRQWEWFAHALARLAEPSIMWVSLSLSLIFSLLCAHRIWQSGFLRAQGVWLLANMCDYAHYFLADTLVGLQYEYCQTWSLHQTLQTDTMSIFRNSASCGCIRHLHY